MHMVMVCSRLPGLVVNAPRRRSSSVNRLLNDVGEPVSVRQVLLRSCERFAHRVQLRLQALVKSDQVTQTERIQRSVEVDVVKVGRRNGVRSVPRRMRRDVVMVMMM